MSPITRFLRRALFVAFLLLLIADRRAPAAQSAAPAAQATCVFTNPSFAGKCTETAAMASGSTAAQACQSILQCLNNVDCLKTYCQATTIRSGWKLESAK